MSLRLLFLCFLLGATSLFGQRQMDRLGRGLVATPVGPGTNFLSWRILATDPPDVAFNLHRSMGENRWSKLNPEPLRAGSNFLDTNAPADGAASYLVAIQKAGREEDPSQPASVKKGQPRYLSIRLRTPEGYAPNDASAGDLDGDGEYDLVVHQVGRGRDNSREGMTSEPILEAYRLDGTFLWRINLGKNIREGAHYTQFMVFDLDGDGLAEVACKTADGTRDGKGQVIGDGAADHRGKEGRTLGRVLTGPEYLTIFDGKTGAALATTNYYPARGKVEEWGDDHGNRSDRFLACIAFLDGKRPSLVMCRGYYTRAVLAAWNWHDGKLSRVWTFDTEDGTPGNEKYRGQGNHNLSVGDVDGDGRDEIIYGSCLIGSDGKGRYSTGLGHGDAMHFSDLDPDRPGLEVFKGNGDRPNPAGIQLRDAASGKQIWGIASTGRGGVVRAAAFDIDPRHRGAEMWGKGEGVEGLFNAKGEKISTNSPRSCNMGIWWDDDFLRELLDGVNITKWNHLAGEERRIFSAGDFGGVANNGSKSNPSLCADLFGDWREELVVRSQDNRELRIFSTTIPTARRLVTLMQDPVYRLGIAWQNVAYNQSAHTSFFLGETKGPTEGTNSR